MNNTFDPLPAGSVSLAPSLFQQRFALNRRYLIALKSENLLQNFYMEAGLWSPPSQPKDIHWGWESPTSQVRGHFLGHWLSAAASVWATTGDQEVKGKADYIVSELARCQRENGGEWVASIPKKYLDWAAHGKAVWAPHYVVHKTLMGLYDMASVGKNAQAMDVLARAARWFYRWTGQFSRDQMNDILDHYETGGMLEAWANLYGLTGEKEHLELVRRYDRTRFFDALLAGKDVLTNSHMNTTIPEAQGAARAWEVTGEERWRKVAEAYWRLGVTQRGYYATGAQTNGEIWAPPGQLSARLGDKTQEHCVVYNMMRLADIFLRWNGDVDYADYWERNLYNGVLAQQHPETGMIAYFLPLRSGSIKRWGTPTDDFWCCHGTLVQAQAMYASAIYYQDAEGLVVSQYIPNTLAWTWDGVKVKVSLAEDLQLDRARRPENVAYTLTVVCERPVEFALKVRLPWWINGSAEVSVNQHAQLLSTGASSWVTVRQKWSTDTVSICLSRRLTACPLPDDPQTVAFMEGPVVLAGILGSAPEKDSRELIDEKLLVGDPDAPEALLGLDNEREWGNWRMGYRTRGQAQNIRFMPLYEVSDERYQVYFPIKAS